MIILVVIVVLVLLGLFVFRMYDLIALNVFPGIYQQFTLRTLFTIIGVCSLFFTFAYQQFRIHELEFQLANHCDNLYYHMNDNRHVINKLRRDVDKIHHDDVEYWSNLNKRKEKEGVK